ncbi:MAG: hydrogenase maturation protease [bacterium]
MAHANRAASVGWRNPSSHEDAPRLRVLLIGLGNEFRRDDSAGLLVARALRARRLPCADIVESPGEGSALMDLWKNREHVFLFDASVSGAAVGTITRVDAAASGPPTSFSLASSHAFSALEAVELARRLGQLPRSLIIYAIAGRDFGFGTDLSPEVSAAVNKVVSRVCREVASLSKRSGWKKI